METTAVPYDLCRRYLADRMPTLPAEIYESILGLIRSRNLASLCNLVSLFGGACHDHLSFGTLLQVEAFFKKNGIYSDDVVCNEAALTAFNKAEEICRITNKRLDHFYVNRDRLDPDVNFWLSRMEEIISSVLGPYEDFVGRLPFEIKVTPGATATRSRRESLPYMKLSRHIDVTPSASKYVESIYRTFGYGKIYRPTFVVWNRVQTVPKNWKTHRTIACEPAGNVPLQLAFDGYTKDRLRRKLNVDLRYQSRNQRLSYEGSVDGSLATIDLSAASDTVAFNTVAWLFPEPWFQYLCDVRSPFYSNGSSLTRYAKFSSMGNGATFTIETLIFAAACRALGSRRFSVYGDDIIIETELYPDLKKLLKFLGFSVNQEKSHHTGPYRESCGEHWFDGVNVTPFYLRDWSMQKNLLCHNVNGLASIAGERLGSFLADLTVSEKLPLIPLSYDSMQGVFIDTPTCYDLGILKTKLRRFGPWRPHYKGYVSTSRKRLVHDSRTLALWFLRVLSEDVEDRNSARIQRTLRGRMNLGGVTDFSARLTVTSLVPILSHKFRLRWVGWTPPAMVAPVHLYWWTDLVIRRRESGG